MSWKFFDATGKLQISGAAGGGGGGAPTTAPYVTTAADAGLSAEKVLGTDVLKRGTAAGKPASPDFEGQFYAESDGSRILWRGNSSGGWDEVGRAVTTAAPVNVTKAANAEGTATSLARSDHKHDITTAAASDLANANAEGSATSLARSDHAHKRTIRVAKAGVDVGTRNRLNLIEGTNVTITVADDGANDEVDVTIAASGGGGGGVTVEDRDVVEAEVVNTTTETAVYSYSVPGGTLGANGHLRLTMIGDYLNNSGGSQTLTIRVKYGATTLFAIWNEAIASNASRKPNHLVVDLIAANATNAQRAFARYAQRQAASGTDGSNSSLRESGNTSVAVDSTTAQTLQVTVQHSAANANLSYKTMTAILEKL